jgi:hypothetical protein
VARTGSTKIQKNFLILVETGTHIQHRNYGRNAFGDYNYIGTVVCLDRKYILFIEFPNFQYGSNKSKNKDKHCTS